MHLGSIPPQVKVEVPEALVDVEVAPITVIPPHIKLKIPYAPVKVDRPLSYLIRPI